MQHDFFSEAPTSPEPAFTKPPETPAQKPSNSRVAPRTSRPTAAADENPNPEEEWKNALMASVLSADDLQNLNLPPRQSLLGSWFKEGDLGFIFGPRGLGKTWVSMLLAKAIACGASAGPWKAPSAQAVLYVDGEMPADAVKEREASLAPNGPNLFYLNHEIMFEKTGKVLNLSSPFVQKAVLKLALEKNIKVIVLDNLSCLCSGVKENDADAWEMVLRWLLDLRRQRIAVVFVHHSGRNGEMRGTSRREDAAFWMIRLNHVTDGSDKPNTAKFVSTFTKNRNGGDEAIAFEWTFQSEGGKTTVRCSPSKNEDIFRSLIEQGLTSCTEIAEEMKVTKGAVSKLAHKAVGQGWLKIDGREYRFVGDQVVSEMDMVNRQPGKPAETEE